MVSATVVNIGAGKKMEKKSSLDGLASTRRTVAVVARAKPGAGGLSRPSMLGQESGWTPTLVVVVLQSSTRGWKENGKEELT